MVQVNDYIKYKVYERGTKDYIIEEDIKFSGTTNIYVVGKPQVKLLNGFIKKIGSLPKDVDFKTHFIIYFIDYTKIPKETNE